MFLLASLYLALLLYWVQGSDTHHYCFFVEPFHPSDVILTSFGGASTGISCGSGLGLGLDDDGVGITAVVGKSAQVIKACGNAPTPSAG